MPWGGIGPTLGWVRRLRNSRTQSSWMSHRRSAQTAMPARVYDLGDISERCRWLPGLSEWQAGADQSVDELCISLVLVCLDDELKRQGFQAHVGWVRHTHDSPLLFESRNLYSNKCLDAGVELICKDSSAAFFALMLKSDRAPLLVPPRGAIVCAVDLEIARGRGTRHGSVGRFFGVIVWETAQ